MSEVSPPPLGAALNFSPIAFLVDRDNASPTLIEEMLAEAARYRTVELRCVYGDWASGRLASWRTIVREHALVLIQQFASFSQSH